MDIKSPIQIEQQEGSQFITKADLDSAIERIVNEIALLLRKHIDRLDRRIDQLESRMEKIEQRMDKIEQKMDKLERRMDGLESKMTKGFAYINARLDAREDMEREREVSRADEEAEDEDAEDELALANQESF